MGPRRDVGAFWALEPRTFETNGLGEPVERNPVIYHRVSERLTAPFGKAGRGAPGPILTNSRLCGKV